MINFKKEVALSVDETIDKVSEILKTKGFGVLTRIDFDKKMKEKLGKDLKPVVILGACNPSLAFEAYTRNSDVTSLLPCNIVVSEVTPSMTRVEIAKPTALMTILGDDSLIEMAKEADTILQNALELL